MAAPVVKVAALCGSLRKGSYNRALLRAAMEISKSVDGLEIEYVDISPLPFLNTDLEVNGRFPESVEAFREKIQSADSILFASPEYNYSISGPLKNAIDWASRAPNVWADKAAAIVSAGGDGGGVRSQYHLRQIGVYLDLHFINKPEFFLDAFQCPAKFDSENNLTDEQTKERLKELLLSLYMFTLRVQDSACKSRNSRAKSSKLIKKPDLTPNQSRRQQIVPRKPMLEIQIQNPPEAQKSLGQSGEIHIVPEITPEHQIGPDECIQDTGGSLKGTKAPTWEELYLKYKTHANALGFCVRKSTTRRLKSITKLAEIYFLCSCEGQSKSTLVEIANPSPLAGLPCPVTGNQNTVKKRKRRVTFERTGCQARMRVKYSKKDDLYEVVKHVTEHNHPMSITEFNQLKQSDCPISEEGRLIEQLEEKGSSPPEGYNISVQTV